MNGAFGPRLLKAGEVFVPGGPQAGVHVFHPNPGRGQAAVAQRPARSRAIDFPHQIESVLGALRIGFPVQKAAL